jgi:hypothetical protein
MSEKTTPAAHAAPSRGTSEAPATAPAQCCAPSVQSSCCEPAAKSACCGEAKAGTCGCR